MKINGNGQAKVLSPQELELLFTKGFENTRDRLIFGICYFTACRISECLSLRWDDIKNNTITFRRANTKGKLKTRIVNIHSQLEKLILEYIKSGYYYKSNKTGYIFPSTGASKMTMGRARADVILSTACAKVGIVGVSTHSFRRTCLTTMSNSGTPLRHIQAISGHSDLGTLQRYLEVSPEHLASAVNTLGWDITP